MVWYEFFREFSSDALDSFTVAAGDGIDVSTAGSVATVSAKTATTDQLGSSELATDAETNAGTDTSRNITPSNLGQWPGSTNITTLGTVASGTWQGTAVTFAYGGTGNTSYTDGQLLIGNAGTGGLTKSTLTAGTSISIANGNGSITINSSFTPSSTDTLTNKTFDANGTGNSLSNVDVADLANGTDGELITWDAAGAPATVSTGTSGHVLTSNGAGAAPTFQAVAATDLDWELLSAQTASSSSAINFTSNISSTYAAYCLVITDLAPATDGQRVAFQTSTDGGSSYDNGASDYAWGSEDSGTYFSSSGDTSVDIAINGVGSASNEQFSGHIYIYDPSASNYTKVTWAGTYLDGTTTARIASGGGYRLSTTAVDAFRVLMNSGNITSGEFRLYGLRNA